MIHEELHSFPEGEPRWCWKPPAGWLHHRLRLLLLVCLSSHKHFRVDLRLGSKKVSVGQIEG